MPRKKPIEQQVADTANEFQGEVDADVRSSADKRLQRQQDASYKKKQDEAEKKPTIVEVQSNEVAKQIEVVRFRNRPMMLTAADGFDHYIPLRKEIFDSVAYPLLGGVSRARMNDIFAYVSNMARDLTGNDHLILFGTTAIDDTGKPLNGMPFVWDSRALLPTDIAPTQAVWRSPYAIGMPKKKDGQRIPVPFVMSLAGGDQGVYDDIMQSIAPLIMERKPDGVIWWVGEGANGKSTLMDALYKIFPGQFASLTVKRLVDGRDTPSLNGTLANIVKESSEGRIEDTEIYKAIGTHEDFRVHKFHSQDDITIRGNMHHIFSANSIPSFNDKGYSARRRTFIIPFREVFESDPTFEEKTFTVEMFSHLISEMTHYAARLRDQGYRYKWSAATLAAKANYDGEANNAEEYVSELINQGAVAFNNYKLVQMDYENWAGENGYVALGIGNLKKALAALGFERVSTRGDNGKVDKMYKLPNAADASLVAMAMTKPGIFVAQGFKPTEPEIPQMDGDSPPEPKKVLRGKW